MLKLLLVVGLSLLSFTRGQDFTYLHKKVEHWNILQEIRNEGSHEFLENAQNTMDSIMKLWTEPGYAQKMVEANPSVSVSESCLMAALNLTTGAHDSAGLPAIVDVIDSFGKLGPGILKGDIYLTGSYDECLDLPGQITQYCKANIELPIHLPIPIPFSLGVCAPQQCNETDIEQLISMIPGVHMAEFNPFAPGAPPVDCQSYKDPPYHWTAIVMIMVCCIILGITLLCTTADLIIRLWRDGTIQDYLRLNPRPRNSSELSDVTPLLRPTPVTKYKRFDPVEWIEAFSLIKNINTIMSTKQTSAAITCLNGLRVISILWVILCHSHIWVMTAGADNLLDIINVFKRFSFQAVLNGFFSVDSFFFLSGLLVAYLTLRQMKRQKGKFPFVMFYVHRYLRLTPVYAFVLFFVFFLMPHLGNGPDWKGNWVGGAQWQICSKYWWTNLLYINNFYPWTLGEECIGWSWYLANDMQFFIISPLIIIPMYFLFPVGLLIASAFLFGSFVITATLTGVYNFQSSTFAAFAYNTTGIIDPNHNSQDLLYIKPWHRIQPYLVGLVLGYLLYKNIRVPFNRLFKLGSYLFMWGLAIIFCMSTVYGLYNIWHGHIPSLAENIIYLTFSRFVWAVGLALLVYICHNGYGGWINTFLSMKLWIPLSRLAFNAYLIHPVVLTVVYGSSRVPIHYSDINLAVIAVAVSVISFGSSFLLTAFVEFPFGNLEAVFFKLFGVGARESTRADTEAKPASPLQTKSFIGSYSNGEKKIQNKEKS